MKRYGFRLFAVELRPNNTHSSVPFRAENKSDDAVDAIDAFGQALHAKENYTVPLIRKAAVVASDDSETQTPAENVKGSVVRLTQAQVDGDQLRVSFYWGAIQDGLVIDPDGSAEDTPFTARSLAHIYRATLNTKPGTSIGLLAVEANGSACPHLQFRRAVRAVTEKQWSLFQHDRIVGAAEWMHLIHNGFAKSAQFYDYGFDADGANHPVRLDASLTDEAGTQETFRTAAKAWVKQRYGIELTNEESEPKAIDEVLQTAIGKKVSGLSFDDFATTFKLGTTTRTVRSTSTFTNFTYETSDNRPPDEVFWSESAAVCASLIESAQQVVSSGSDE